MAPTDSTTVTREELLAVFRKWETERRLHPARFTSEFEDREQDVDVLAERSADRFEELVDEVRPTVGETVRAIIDEKIAERLIPRLTWPTLPPLDPSAFVKIRPDDRPPLSMGEKQRFAVLRRRLLDAASDACDGGDTDVAERRIDEVRILDRLRGAFS